MLVLECFHMIAAVGGTTEYPVTIVFDLKKAKSFTSLVTHGAGAYLRFL